MSKYLHKDIRCLDSGYVRLIDFMGSDERIVQAARISTNKASKGKDADNALIRYLVRNKHTSPLEMCEVMIEVKLPIFVARQWIRHRTANVNELSGRYTTLETEFYSPEIDRFVKGSEINKQSSSKEPIFAAHTAHESIINFQEFAAEHYDYLLGTELNNEIARINLPLSTYTVWYWKCDLHNIFHFLKLRCDSHAQYEIRVYADAIAEIIKELFPMAYAAFEEYILNSITFSETELKILSIYLDRNSDIINGIIAEGEARGLGKSELAEFITKMERLVK